MEKLKKIIILCIILLVIFLIAILILLNIKQNAEPTDNNEIGEVVVSSERIYKNS